MKTYKVYVNRNGKITKVSNKYAMGIVLSKKTHKLKGYVVTMSRTVYKELKKNKIRLSFSSSAFRKL